MNHSTGNFDPFAPFLWRLAHGRMLELGPAARIMAIVNVTPDSFSDGGRYCDVDNAVERARTLFGEGADIVDIGGESTRPGAEPITAAIEQARVLPVIEQLAKDGNGLISIDTYRAMTAKKALEAGAHIVNDVWALQKDPGMAGLVAGSGAGICMMHTGRERIVLPDPVDDQIAFLSQSLDIAKRAGISQDAIIVDPGFGFAKDGSHNVELLARLGELHRLGQPLMTGTSRKRFLGQITGAEADDRDVATAATSVIARYAGSAIFRVHDVTTNRQALAVADRILAANRVAQ